MSLGITSLPADIIVNICEATWAISRPIIRRAPAPVPRNEAIACISLTCKRLREIVLPLLFRDVYNWKKSTYNGGAWPSTVWPHIRTVTIYDFPGYGRSRFDNEDTLLVLPNLLSVHRVNMSFMLTKEPRPYLLAVSSLPNLRTLTIQQNRLEDPSLASVFATMCQLSTLTLRVAQAVIRPAPSFDAHSTEVDNVHNILKAISPVLSELEISGDLVKFDVIASIKWPNLRSLRLVDHIPYHCDFIPLSVLVCNMPVLRTLACDFKAERTPRYPLLYCLPDDPPLATAVPGLLSLSISNPQPGETIFEQLPPELTEFRVVSLRDITKLPDYHAPLPLFGYSTLSRVDVSCWIDALSSLPNLVRLTLTLESVPSVMLLVDLARACPRLQYLALEQAFHELNCNTTTSDEMESLIVPLQSLSQLQELRLSLELGHSVQFPDGLTAPTSFGTLKMPVPSPHILPEFKELAKEACRICASRVDTLNTMGVSCRNINLSRFDRLHIWYMMDICRVKGVIYIQEAELA